MTLAEFLLARLNEAEQHARKDLAWLDAASPTPWRAWHGYNLPASHLRDAEGNRIAEFVATGGPQYHANGIRVDGYEDRHSRDVAVAARMVTLARGRAEAMLADIAAKRRIIDRAMEAEQRANSKPGYDSVARLEKSLARVTAPALERILRLLALPFATHPDYQEDWAP